MKRYFLVFVISCVQLVLLANDTLFFKHNVLPVESKSEAEFYWILEQIAEIEDEILLSKYYANDTLMARTYFTSYKREVKSGDELCYYPNSQLARKKQYLDGKLHGKSQFYTLDGELQSESYYLFGEEVKRITLINKDSLKLTERELGLMQLFEDMPIHIDCIQIENEEERNQCASLWMQKYIGRTTRYPAQPRDAGIDGRIWIRYIVNEKGSLEEIEVIETVEGGGALEAEAIRVILTLPEFVPGASFGERVKVQYTVPINFKLR